jgi:large subunit ribosomal protein L23
MYNINLLDVLKKNHNTEKTNMLFNKYNCITCNVEISSNKIKIKNTVESLFDVKVKSIKIINVKGKKVRFKGILGKKQNYKKAIIFIKDKKVINFSEFKYI